MNGYSVKRIDKDCDVEVNGHRYCTGQYPTKRDAARELWRESRRLLALSEFLDREIAAKGGASRG